MCTSSESVVRGGFVLERLHSVWLGEVTPAHIIIRIEQVASMPPSDDTMGEAERAGVPFFADSSAQQKRKAIDGEGDFVKGAIGEARKSYVSHDEEKLRIVCLSASQVLHRDICQQPNRLARGCLELTSLVGLFLSLASACQAAEHPGVQ